MRGASMNTRAKLTSILLTSLCYFTSSTSAGGNCSYLPSGSIIREKKIYGDVDLKEKFYISYHNKDIVPSDELLKHCYETFAFNIPSVRTLNDAGFLKSKYIEKLQLTEFTNAMRTLCSTNITSDAYLTKSTILKLNMMNFLYSLRERRKEYQRNHGLNSSSIDILFGLQPVSTTLNANVYNENLNILFKLAKSKTSLRSIFRSGKLMLWHSNFKNSLLALLEKDKSIKY